jgi:hypothetical protein
MFHVRRWKEGNVPSGSEVITKLGARERRAKSAVNGMGVRGGISVCNANFLLSVMHLQRCLTHCRPNRLHPFSLMTMLAALQRGQCHRVIVLV